MEVVQLGRRRYRVDVDRKRAPQHVGEVILLAVALDNVLPTCSLASSRPSIASRSVGWSTSAGDGHRTLSSCSFVRS